MGNYSTTNADGTRKVDYREKVLAIYPEAYLFYNVEEDQVELKYTVSATCIFPNLRGGWYSEYRIWKKFWKRIEQRMLRKLEKSYD